MPARVLVPPSPRMVLVAVRPTETKLSAESAVEEAFVRESRLGRESTTPPAALSVTVTWLVVPETHEERLVLVAFPLAFTKSKRDGVVYVSASEPVVVALVVVAYVKVEFVAVRFAITAVVIVASVAVSVSMMPVTKWATDEYRLVVVAFVTVAYVPVKLVNVPFVAKRLVLVAFVVVLFVASRFGNVELAVVEVAVKYGASISPYEVSPETVSAPVERVPLILAFPTTESGPVMVVVATASVLPEIEPPVKVESVIAPVNTV